MPKADPIHGSTRLFYRPLPHVAAARERANLGVRHCINCVSHAAVMMANCRDREAVFCACLSYASNSTFSPFHTLLTATKQSSNQSIFNQSCSVHDRRRRLPQTASTPLVALARAEKNERDDLLSVRLAPHAIQSLITTRTSNCDYSFLLYTSSIPYTSLRQQPRPCATSLEQTRLTRLRRRQLSCNVVSRPSCANREPTPSTCMLRYLSSLCYHSTRHYLPCRLVSR